MTRSELIDLMADGQSQLSAKDVELAVKLLIDHMAETLSSGQRIEIRGFGSFSLHYREPRQGRNPRTGDAVSLKGKHVPQSSTIEIAGMQSRSSHNFKKLSMSYRFRVCTTKFK